MQTNASTIQVTTPAVHEDFSARNQQQRILLLGLMGVLLVIAFVYWLRRKNSATP